MAFQADLIRIIQELSFCRDLDALMEVLRSAVRALTGADGATVVLRDGNLCHYADEDAIAPLWKGKRFAMATCISGWCMLNRRQVAIADIYADDRIPHDAYRPTFVKSLAMTPIRTADPIGAIGAYWADHHHATLAELERLQALGDAASTAFTNVQLFESLQEASRRKDEFLLMLAHELRNPLGPIRNAAHVLRSESNGVGSAAKAEGVIDRQVQHLSRIVDDLLDVSRIATGAIELRRERVDLARIVADTVEDYRSVLESGGLFVRVSVPDVPVWVSGDAVRLAQVIGNLLDNARKYTPQGEVAVVVEGRGAREAVLRVRDTGIGIRSELLPHVFEPFTQADRSLARTPGGLGLGLSLARGVLELHGGSISAASDGEGRGTEVVILLPRLDEPPALDGPVPAVDVLPKRMRILVIEDNVDAAETLRAILEFCGFETHVAHTGPEGRDAALTLVPDVILSDIGLPGMDGYELARALRGDPTTATARLIAITGYGSEEDRRRALDAGFDLHLVKPVPPRQLIERLAALVA
jgi:signal transduction histidine kinase